MVKILVFQLRLFELNYTRLWREHFIFIVRLRTVITWAFLHVVNTSFNSMLAIYEMRLTFNLCCCGLDLLSHDDLHWALSLCEDKRARLALTSQSF